MIKRFCIVALGLGSLALACDEQEGGGSAPTGTTKPAATGAAAAAAAQGGPLPQTGVKECDDLAAKWAACAEKKPAVKAKEAEVREKLDVLKADAQRAEVKSMVPMTCKMFFEMKLTECG